MSSDNTLRSKLQAHVDATRSAIARAAVGNAHTLQCSLAVEQAGDAATHKARERVMAVSTQKGGLVGRFQSLGGDERAFQRMFAECIGGIDESIAARSRAFRDGALAHAEWTRTLEEQLRCIVPMLDIATEPAAAEPDAS